MASRAEAPEATNLTSHAVNALAIEASERIADFVKISPIVESRAGIAIKDETVQLGRSFKDRGAGNAVLFHADNGEDLVVTASAGNHGRGVARAAAEQGIESFVVVSKKATKEKKNRIRAHGAELVEHGHTFDQALQHGLSLAEERDGRFVHPFADELVIAGQATIGLELLEQEPDMTHLVLPVGGGGLLAGVSSIIKQYKKDVVVVAAQIVRNKGYVDSLKSKQALQNCPVDTRFEGIAVGNINPITFNLARETVDDTVVLETDEIYRAAYDFRRENRTLLESAGAVGIAGAKRLSETLSDENARIVTIATGANPPKSFGPYIDARVRRFDWDVDN